MSKIKNLFEINPNSWEKDHISKYIIGANLGGYVMSIWYIYHLLYASCKEGHHASYCCFGPSLVLYTKTEWLVLIDNLPPGDVKHFFVGWVWITTLKFGMVVLQVFLMIWLTFGMNPLKTKWLPQPFKKKWPPKMLVGTITYEPLVGLHSKLVWLFSRYFWWYDKLLGWIHKKQNGCRSQLKKIDMVVRVILTDEFCLFFKDMTYVPGQFIPSFFGTKP